MSDRPYHAPKLSRRWYAGWLVIALIMLGWVFWNRGAIEPATLFFITLVLGAGAGGLLGGVFHEYY